MGREERQALEGIKKELRLKRVNRQQMILRAVEVEKLIEPEPPARAMGELVGGLDLSAFRAEIEVVKGEAGRPAYDPWLLISLWIYAYSEGVSSAREVARRCGYHPAYPWLTGCEVVNHHRLSDFRVEPQAARDELFAQVLGVLSSEGLLTLERVMHDGTKGKAPASGKSFRREKPLRDHLEQARQRVRARGDPRQEEGSARQVQARERAAREKVERLEQALKERQKLSAPGKPGKERRGSETDPEARIMKQGGGGYAPSHHVQLSTDAAHTVIVGVSVTPSANDEGQLTPALEEVKRNLGRLPQQGVADAGYTPRETILEMAERPVDFLGGTVAAGKLRRPGPGVAPAFRGAVFAYEAEYDTYRCPAGKELRRRGIERRRVGVLHHVYQAPAADGGSCAFRQQGCGGAAARRIFRSENVPGVRAFIEKMQTAAAQAIYRLRGAVAEFPNAWLKAKMGLRQFRLRGLKKVRGETLWACLAYNLSPWVRLRWKARRAEA